MAKRTGLPSIKKTAKRLCRFLTKYQALIKALYPENTDLHNALDAAQAACALLESEAMNVIELGV
jgi:hypothetical protein